MDPQTEMRELQRLFEVAPHGAEFLSLQRSSKWGERIREEVIEGILLKQPEAIEDGVLFLEENPRYFRTGYFKASIASKLKSVPLTESQRHRLREAILRAITSNRVGPEFTEYARLAAVIVTSDFHEKVVGLRDRLSGWQRGRCERILNRIKE